MLHNKRKTLASAWNGESTTEIETPVSRDFLGAGPVIEFLNHARQLALLVDILSRPWRRQIPK